MALITLRDICMSFGAEPLLDRVNLTVASGERICLLGRNGVGKTTLMGIIGGSLSPDSGEVMRSQGVTVSAWPRASPKTFTGRCSMSSAGEWARGESVWRRTAACVI